MYPFNLGFDELGESDLEAMKAPLAGVSAKVPPSNQPAQKPHQPGYGHDRPAGPGFGPNFPGFGPGMPGFGPNPPGREPDKKPVQEPDYGPGHGFEGGYSKPAAPPPAVIPEKKSMSLLKIDSGSIRGCLLHNTYVWLKNGVDFWFFPVYIGKTSISGFRWTRYGWAYTGVDLSWIDFFQCV